MVRSATACGGDVVAERVNAGDHDQSKFSI
jgi:hypothetical protein